MKSIKAKASLWKIPEFTRRKKFDISKAKTFGRRFDDADVVDTYHRTERLVNAG